MSLLGAPSEDQGLFLSMNLGAPVFPPRAPLHSLVLGRDFSAGPTRSQASVSSHEDTWEWARVAYYF